MSDKKNSREKWIERLPLFKKEDETRVQKIIHANKLWKGDGFWVRETEKKFLRYLETKRGVFVNSGSTALEIAIQACEFAPGSEIIVPAYSFYATASAVLRSRCVPVFVDILSDTHCISPAAIEKTITAKTVAVIPVHLGGTPCEMNHIMRVAKKHSLIVIEDAAQAFGTKIQYRHAGTIGDVGCFSFQQYKNISSGEGGMIVTRSERLFRKIYELHDCGRRPGKPLHEHYGLGGNYRMTEIQAALLAGQLKRLNKTIVKKSRAVRFLTQTLSKIKHVHALPFPSLSGNVIAWNYFIIRMDHPKVTGPTEKQQFMDLLNKKGLFCYHYPTTLYDLPIFRKSRDSWRKRACPNAEAAAYRQSIFIPQEVLMSERGALEKIPGMIQKAIVEFESR